MGLSISAKLSARAGVMAALLGGAAPGCGAPASVCDATCDCEGCDEAMRAECVDSWDGYRKVAEEDGCSVELDELESCMRSNLACEDGEARLDGCDAQLDRMLVCSWPSPCEQAAADIQAKMDECAAGDPDAGSETSECTQMLADQSSCMAACTLAAPCSALTGVDADEAMLFQDCLAGC